MSNIEHYRNRLTARWQTNGLHMCFSVRHVIVTSKNLDMKHTPVRNAVIGPTLTVVANHPNLRVWSMHAGELQRSHGASGENAGGDCTEYGALGKYGLSEHTDS